MPRQFRSPRAVLPVRTTARPAEERPLYSRKSHPDEPPVRAASAAPRSTPHPAYPPDARQARRAGGLPGRRDRPAPAAWATSPPPAPSAALPPAAAPVHFPPWAIAAILAATVVPSVATTLITLALEHTRRARRAPAATTRRCVIGAAVCGAVILAVMLGTVRLHRTGRRRRRRMRGAAQWTPGRRRGLPEDPL